MSNLRTLCNRQRKNLSYATLIENSNSPNFSTIQQKKEKKKRKEKKKDKNETKRNKTKQNQIKTNSLYFVND